MGADRSKFEEVCLPLLPDCYAFALSLTRKSHEAEDLVQDTFLKAQRAFGSFTLGTNAKAWLFTILRRLHIDRYRRQRLRPTPLPEDELAEMAGSAATARPPPAEEDLPWDALPAGAVARRHRRRPGSLPPAGPTARSGRVLVPRDRRDPQCAGGHRDEPAAPGQGIPQAHSRFPGARSGLGRANGRSGLVNVNQPPHSGDLPASSPATVDRWLDGESPADEAARLESALRDDPQLAARVAARRRYLATLASAGQAYRNGLAAQMPAHVDARVRLALAGRRQRRLPWPALAAAATLLLAVGAFLWSQQPEQAEAVPAAILRAVDHAALDANRAGTCASEDEVTRNSALVQMGDYQVADCRGGGSEPSARLARVRDLPVVGWAATRTTDEVKGPDIGMTVLQNYVVFDVARGRQREYLAVARVLYDELERQKPKRASCVVCHNRSREGQENPHDIKLRKWR